MEQRNSKISTIIIIFLTLLIIMLLAFLYIQNKTTKKLTTDLAELQTKLEQETQEINKDEELSFYKNIEKNLKNKYDEYYTNISLLEKKIENKETNVKIAYLTFDDGPYELTYQVLDLLKQNNIRATFFVLGKTGVEDRYKRIVEEGHTLANHTYYHNIGTGLYNSVESFMSQVKKLEEYLYDITGYRTTIVRFPGGSSTAKNLKDDIVEELHKNGYNYVDWTSETGDGSSKKLAEKDTWTWYVDTTKDKNIIVLLMHDYNYSTFDNLQRIIDDLKNRGFIFLPLHNKSIMAK